MDSFDRFPRRNLTGGVSPHAIGDDEEHQGVGCEVRILVVITPTPHVAERRRNAVHSPKLFRVPVGGQVFHRPVSPLASRPAPREATS